MGSDASQEGMQCGDSILSRFAIDAADSKGGHLAFVVFIDPAHRCCEEEFFSVGPRGEGQTASDLRVEVRHVPALKIEASAVLLGDVFNIDELGKGRYDFVMRKDEDFGSCDWIEPFLDPAPDDGEERRGTENLDGGLSAFLSRYLYKQTTYKNAI